MHIHEGILECVCIMASPSTPVPVLPMRLRRLSFDEWYDRYHAQIEYNVERLLSRLEQHPHIHSHLNKETFYELMVEHMYKTSSNSYKDVQHLY